MSRQFTTYEYNQLIKYGFDPYALKDIVDSNIPVEYITGHVEFCNSVFEVNQNVLIPRVETEEIIDLALSILDKQFPNKKLIEFCDIGTGSGAIGISFAKELFKRKIFLHGKLSDISKNALKIAVKNAKTIFDLSIKVFEKDDDEFIVTIPLEQFDFIRFIQSNLFEKYGKKEKFDFIFANLPYIPSGRISGLDSPVKDFEPLNALDGGEDGLNLIRNLINQAQFHLKKNGVLLLEVDDTHTNADEFKDNWNVGIKKDSLGNNRFWVLNLKTQ